MRVIVATVQVPFVSGGAERLAQGLCQALRQEGHEAEIVAVPFKWYPAERILDHMLACRLLDLTEAGGTRVDRLIALKFPAYLIQHASKTLWLAHLHRPAYDLWGTGYEGLDEFPGGEAIRDALSLADRRGLSEADAVYTISANVSRRLEEHCGTPSVPIYPPPLAADAFHRGEAQEYLFCPSRFSVEKRQRLVIEAMAATVQPVKVVFAGFGASSLYAAELRELAQQLRVDDRVTWCGEVGQQQLVELYASCLGVVYPPFDEDLGYVTLEAMLSGKPVLTCSDSGGPLEFVVPEATGLVAEPTAEALARAMDALWSDPGRANRWGDRGARLYRELDISWGNVLRRLLPCD